MEFEADFKKDGPNVNCCKFSKDNGLLATGGADGVVRVFQLETKDFFSSVKKLHELVGHFETITGVDISPDQRLLISSSSDKSCLIFNLQKGG